MDRSLIKNEAKEIVKKNMLNIWKALIISLASSILYSVLFTYVFNNPESALYNGLSIVYNLITIPLAFGVSRYTLKIARKEKATIKDVFYYYIHKIIESIALSILMSIFLVLGYVLFVIPAVIMFFMFIMAENIFVDGITNPMEALKKSKELMKGYKWDYFNFLISFMGWLILGIFTVGIAYIWVLPYVTISQKIYYDKLIEIKKFDISKKRKK